MRLVFKRGPGGVEANLTPMIDVTFLLIIFFVLVSQIVEVENVELALPQPTDPRTMRITDEARVVINVVPASEGRAEGYRIGVRGYPATPEGVALLAEQIAAMYQRNPGLNVNLRADRNTHYSFIHPVMSAVVTAARASGREDANPSINLVVIPDE